MRAAASIRTGLVLGAGGVLGGAWMAGALHALADRTRWYPRHADHLAGQGLDLAIVLSPLSSRARFRGWDPLNRLTDATRRVIARQLDAEICLLESEGARVAVIEPTADDLAAIGGNVMDERRRARVMQTPTRTTLQQLKGPALRNLQPLLKAAQERHREALEKAG